jgi:hypothetical protein
MTPERRSEMTKREEIAALNRRLDHQGKWIDKLEKETAVAIEYERQRVEVLLDRLEDIRNMVAEVADRPEWRSNALPADINAALAKDVADLDEGPNDWFFGSTPRGPGPDRLYGKSPTEIIKASTPWTKGNIYDDVIARIFEPTDEDLDQIDELVDALIDDRG